MKNKLLITLFAVLFFKTISQAQSINSLFVSVQEYTNSWCNNSTGSLIVSVNGGAPPYIYLWSNGATTAQIDFLFPGQYDVTVTDALGATATSMGYVNVLSAPEFYVNSIEMARMGLNNGSVTVSIYPGGSVQYIPNGTYYYDLLDSMGTFIESYTTTVPFNFNPTYTFDSLPAGHYSVQLSTSFAFGCNTYADFRIKEMPLINPTFTTLPACNGSPTGQIVLNTHPFPAINANTFSSNHISNLWVYEVVTSKYKAIVYDQSNNIKGYYRTQDSVIAFNGLLPGNYHLKIYAGDTIETFYPGVHDSLLYYSANFTVANDTLCSLVKGRLFADYNNDCIYNSGDIKLSGTLIELNPGAYSSVTNSNGEFYIPAPVGVYTLKQFAPYQYAQLCPDTNTFTVNVTSTGMVIDVQVADSINANPDLQLGLNGSNARPGFNLYYYLSYRNLTPNNITSQIITLNFDSNLTFVSSSQPYASLTNKQITWNASSLGPFSNYNFNVVLNVPATTVLGTILNADAAVTGAAGETNLANNADAIASTVTGSFDPNDIAVSPQGFESSGYITNFQDLDYTIRFQNTGTDTAFTIIVTDTLPLALDKYSLSVLNASHDYWYEFKNPNLVLFHFDNVLLPDSNVNEEASHGLIKFSIHQKQGNPAGTVIKGNAAIYFDYNAPVITNDVINTVFDCAQMASVSYSTNSICEGDSISAAPVLLFDMNTEWYVDASLYSTDSMVTFLNLIAGNHTIDFLAINSVCDQQITNTLSVNALPPQPIITVVSDSLFSSASTGNQWFLNGSAISGAISSSFQSLFNGWYMVTVTDANGCSSASDSIYIVVGGISNSNPLNIVKIVPNPANDEFQIMGLNVQGVKIVITDRVGKIVYTTESVEQISNLKIPTENLSKGVYFVNAKSGKSIVTLKLLKM